ncbi:MAG: CBS domain-containing protein [Anaerohalosphaeraceae bacterium]
MHYESLQLNKGMDAVVPFSNQTGTCRWAQDLMQKNPALLRQRHTVRQAIEYFILQQLDTLLVVREADLVHSLKLAGRICIKDVLRLILPGLLRKDIAGLHEALGTPVDDILIAHPKTMTPWSNVIDIVGAMLADYTQVVGVEQDGKLAGQVNSQAILKLYVNATHAKSVVEDDNLSPASQTHAEDIMAGYVICLEPDDDIARAICLFLATASRYIPVLDKQARLVGILSQQDILEYISILMDPVCLSMFENKDSILDRPVGTLLKKEPQSIVGKVKLPEAARLIVGESSGCLAVTDTQRKFCGILSYSEIFNWIVRHTQIFEN